MAEPTRVSVPPGRPILIFDGDCGFCRRWIERWKSETGDAVDYAPSQEVAGRFPEIPVEAFRRSVQLVLPTGEVREGAEAVLRALAEAPGRRWPLAFYRRVPGAAPVCELVYRLVAHHRGAASAVTRALWGRRVERPEYGLASDLFVRLVGVCYLAAFVSFWLQVDGLVGSRGILPVADFLAAVRSQAGGARWDLLPTLCWLDSSDRFLHLLCAGGAAASAAAIVGFFPAAALALCWLGYLSLCGAGQVFLEFQWDTLLLETGLLAVFLAPRGRRLASATPPSPTVILLLRWLLFRLMFGSGWVKLASGDPAWRSLSALRYHYETQCLPPWTAWYMHRLPPGFQTFSCAVLFAIELGAPFLILAPRRLRLIGFGAIVFLQLVIAGTGNYAFFNYLAIALCVPLLDDRAFPESWRRRLAPVPATASPPRRRRWPRVVIAGVAVPILVVSSAQMISMVFRPRSFPSPVVSLARAVAPFRSVNTYGLFAVMTTSRPEIIVEGSDDGVSWSAYEFRWKPGDPRRRPPFVAPHQPRLDWQMWFAALGSAEQSPWILAFARRLLEGSPPVVRLLEKTPFPDHPPRFLRAVLYDYRFTDFGQRRASGAWWRREETGIYLPVLSLDMFRR
jgi:predicted DCC family thiol-disulfide oxidoreductase YuxK